MSTGELLVARVAMKPLATLNRPTLGTVDTATKEETVSFKERTDVTAVPAMGVVAETMVALVLADEVLRKFGGDSMGELVRNHAGYLAQVHEPPPIRSHRRPAEPPSTADDAAAQLGRHRGLLRPRLTWLRPSCARRAAADPAGDSSPTSCWSA